MAHLVYLPRGHFDWQSVAVRNIIKVLDEPERLRFSILFGRLAFESYVHSSCSRKSGGKNDEENLMEVLGVHCDVDRCYLLRNVGATMYEEQVNVRLCACPVTSTETRAGSPGPWQSHSDTATRRTRRRRQAHIIMVSSNLHVTECCCGCSLKTGTLIIGYFHAITGFLAMIVCSAVTYMAKTGMPPDYKKDEFLMYAFGIASVLSLIQFVVSVCLLYGAYTGKKVFLLPWKIFAWIGFGFSVVAVVLSFIGLILTGNLTGLAGAVGQGMQAGLLLYFIAVVCSFEDSLVDKTGIVYVAQENPRINVDPMINVQKY